MHFIPFSPFLTTRLAARLDAYRSDAGDDASETRRIAEEIGALPLGSFLLSAYYLRPTGELYSIEAAAAGAEVERVSDEGWYYAALRLGSLRYPELVEALPGKPSASEVCVTCDGTGIVAYKPASGQGPTNVCLDCLGRGWR